MPNRINEPNDLRPPPPAPVNPPHRPSIPPASPAGSDNRIGTSETGHVIPTVYGTARVAGNLLERIVLPLATTATPQWAPSIAVLLGELRLSNGNVYVCTTAGTTSSSGSIAHGPSGTGSGITDGTAVWSYAPAGWRHMVAIGFCEGPVFGALQGWQDKQTVANYANLPHEASCLQLFPGATTGLTRPTWFPATTPATPYSGTAVLLAIVLSGSDATLPNISLEIQGLFADNTHVDVNPADIAIDLLTDNRRGIGWQSARVDAVSTGSGAGSWRTYCTAFGLNLSWVIDTQATVLELLKLLLDATNTDAVWTPRLDGLGGMLKFVPLGDQALTANGVTFTPATTALYSLGPDDFLEPLQVSRRASADCFNSVPVEYTDRASGYRRVTVDDPDMADVDLRGLQRTQTVSFPQTMVPGAAIMLSRIRAQRSLNVRNTYTFKLPWRYLLLEPTDIVTLTDAVMGISAIPVRIVAIEEDQGGEGSFTVTAEDWPAAVAAAAQYTPQGGDGYAPNVQTNTNKLQVLQQQLPPGTVTDAGSSRAGSVDNLWPNSTSENSPPDGADLTTPEWVGRVNAGAGAFAGAWVRQLSALSGAKQLLGSPFVAGGGLGGLAYASELGFTVPCSPGESFYMEAMIKAVTATTGTLAFVFMYFLDANNTILTGASLSSSLTAPISSWTKSTASGTAPVNATQVRFFCSAYSNLGNVTMQFDAIYARRQVDFGIITIGALRTTNYAEDGSGNPTAGAKLSNDPAIPAFKVAPGNLQVGLYIFTDPWLRVLKALEGTASGSGGNGLAWYRGNIDPTGVGSGAPIIHDGTFGDRLSLVGRPSGILFSSGVSTVYQGVQMNLVRIAAVILPQADTDNLDSLRYLELRFYTDLGSAFGGNDGIMRWPIGDRLFNVPATPSNTANEYISEMILPVTNGNVIYNTTPFAPRCYVRATLYNAYGPSDARDYSFITNTVGSNAPSGVTIPGAAAPPSGGGSGGSGVCPAPQTQIMLASGRTMDAGALFDGAQVLGMDPKDFSQTGVRIGTVRRPFLTWAKHRYAVKMTDGRVLKFSKDHKLCTVQRGWGSVQTLRPGDEMVGPVKSVVVSVTDEGLGQVVSFIVEGCHTYFADGVLSHNSKTLP